MKKSIAIAVLSLGFAVTGALSVSAQGVFPPTTGTPTEVQGSGSSVWTTGTTSTTPIQPYSGSTQITGVSGPSSSSPNSDYCTGVGSTILASGSKVGDVLKFFTCFIQKSIIPLLFMLALAVFIWGMVKFITSQASAEKEDGKQFMLWGIIALTVMFSVWGLVNIFQKTFQVENVIPQVKNPN